MRVRDLPYRLVIVVGKSLFLGLRLQRTVIGAQNIPRRGGAVLAITHFGYLDFALCEWTVWDAIGRYTRFLATTAAFRHPVSGPLMRAMRHIPVDRSAGADAYRAAVEALRNGDLVGVFPESYVSRDRTLLPLRTGAVRMAVQAGVPVIPVAVWGGHRVLTAGVRPSLRRAWRNPVTIAFGEPVVLVPGEDPRVGTQWLREALEAMIEQVRDEPVAASDPSLQLKGGTST